MDQTQLTRVQEAFAIIRQAREEADELVEASDTFQNDLLLTAKAARILEKLKDITEAQTWNLTFAALYAHCQITANVTSQEVQDYAITTRRIQRELAELEAA